MARFPRNPEPATRFASRRGDYETQALVEIVLAAAAALPPWPPDAPFESWQQHDVKTMKTSLELTFRAFQLAFSAQRHSFLGYAMDYDPQYTVAQLLDLLSAEIVPFTEPVREWLERCRRFHFPSGREYSCITFARDPDLNEYVAAPPLPRTRPIDIESTHGT